MNLAALLSLPRTRPRHAALVAALALAASAMAPSARAGSLLVLVSAPDGSPAPGVAVQVTPAAAPATPPRAASEPVVIVQKDMRFVPALTVVPVGTTVRFTNQDRFDHHIRSLPGGPLSTLPPATEFEFRLAGAKEKIASAEVRLDTPGAITLGCHLHTTMRGQILVTRTHFVGITDAAGHALVEGLPDGDATVTLWHPEQLTDQPPARVRLAPTPTSLAVTLNFTPPRRRSPRAPH